MNKLTLITSSATLGLRSCAQPGRWSQSHGIITQLTEVTWLSLSQEPRCHYLGLGKELSDPTLRTAGRELEFVGWSAPVCRDDEG
ncbi:hypothetical protein BDW62DRAFT_191287 [Aspergillus aurantiobrunneus]